MISKCKDFLSDLEIFLKQAISNAIEEAILDSFDEVDQNGDYQELQDQISNTRLQKSSKNYILRST